MTMMVNLQGILGRMFRPYKGQFVVIHFFLAAMLIMYHALSLESGEDRRL